MDRREFLTIMGATALTSGAFRSASGQQSYPSRTITFIVPFTPGGSTDILARLLGHRFQESMKATVVIDNRPGAGGGTGSAAVARAEADGYTIGMGPHRHARR